jgi:hypothetical protein
MRNRTQVKCNRVYIKGQNILGMHEVLRAHIFISSLIDNTETCHTPSFSVQRFIKSAYRPKCTTN